ncbi:hypothetical protein Ssal_01214 [Streptococcus salivarius 57.I]|nr:hypothetical protein Ssal_01214 [Streptococcus salivarius 57.I]
MSDLILPIKKHLGNSYLIYFFKVGNMFFLMTNYDKSFKF